MVDVAPSTSGLGSPIDDGDDSLPAVLQRAAAEVIIEKGLGSFSLREVARRAGVSHAAPGYHFGDMRGLLTSMAIQGFQTLERETRAAAEAEDDLIEKLVAVSRAYVRVALTYPAHCEIIWRDDLIDPDVEAYGEAGKAAFAVLVEVIEAIAAERNPELPVQDAAWLCWSSVQGQVTLHRKLAYFAGMEDAPAAEVAAELSDRLARLVATGFERPAS
jgi:AcrR family transcriptional regulator